VKKKGAGGKDEATYSGIQSATKTITEKDSGDPTIPAAASKK